MDRKVFKLPLSKAGLTKYPCPTCGKGVLRVKKDCFHSVETKQSASGHGHDAWEPQWIEYNFCCLLVCTNTTCKDTVSSSGTGSVNESYFYDEEGNTDIDYSDYFSPKIFSPHLKLFDISKNTPENIRDEIEKSFSLFFCDPSSSANHIRAALEHLLTYLKIKRFKTTDRRRGYLSLHRRIDLLPRKYDHVKDIFFAIKWLGNAGSHSHHEVSTDDVFDAYELMEELLVEIFSSKRKQAKSLAKKIIKKKGPK